MTKADNLCCIDTLGVNKCDFQFFSLYMVTNFFMNTCMSAPIKQLINHVNSNILGYPKFVDLSNQRQLLRWKMKRMCKFLPSQDFLLFYPISESKLELKTARNLLNRFVYKHVYCSMRGHLEYYKFVTSLVW